MSTKIFNGYILPTIVTFAEVQDFNRKAASQLRVAANGYEAEILALYITRALDAYYTGIGELTQPEHIIAGGSYYHNIQNDIHTRRKEAARKNGRDPSIDFTAEWALYYHPEVKGILIRFFGEQKMEQAWLKIPNIKPYYYWDNTDKPKNITAKEWTLRARIWEEATQQLHASCTSKAFLSYEQPEIPSKELLFKYQPSFKSRLSKVANKALEADFTRNHPLYAQLEEANRNCAITKDYTKGLSLFNKIIFAFLDYKKTPEGVAELNKIEEQYRRKLPHKYTAVVLKPELTSNGKNYRGTYPVDTIQPLPSYNNGKFNYNV